ncbi:MAG: HAD family hydrolase [Candidatus Nanopelagicales bacterium]
MTLPGAVLFDLDGTLIDSEDLWWEAECLTVGTWGGEWTREDQAHCLGGPLERVTAYMAERTGATVAPEAIGQALLATMEGLLRNGDIEWRPGALDLLVECRRAGIPTALVSASHRLLLDAVADAVADRPGVPSPAFDVTVAGDEVNEGKPHPEPYTEAARRLGVEITDCIVIEDSPTGVASGQASGAFVVAVPHIVAIPAADRRTVVDSLEGVTLADLRDWISLA